MQDPHEAPRLDDDKSTLVKPEPDSDAASEHSDVFSDSGHGPIGGSPSDAPAPFEADDLAGDEPPTVPHPKTMWKRIASRTIKDDYGYGRIPAFWFTLNLPYNYLYEIHRFQRACAELCLLREEADDVKTKDPATERFPADPHQCLDSNDRDAMTMRCNWVLDNPDIVVTLHAIRVELIVRYVVSHIVPPEETEPFQYWLRFEFGQNGNPHAHAIGYVPGNPEFDLVVKDIATKLSMQEKYPEEARTSARGTRRKRKWRPSTTNTCARSIRARTPAVIHSGTSRHRSTSSTWTTSLSRAPHDR